MTIALTAVIVPASSEQPQHAAVGNLSTPEDAAGKEYGTLLGHAGRDEPGTPTRERVDPRAQHVRSHDHAANLQRE